MPELHLFRVDENPLVNRVAVDEAGHFSDAVRLQKKKKLGRLNFYSNQSNLKVRVWWFFSPQTKLKCLLGQVGPNKIVHSKKQESFFFFTA